MNDQQRSTPQPFDDGPRSAVDPHLLPASARQRPPQGAEQDASDTSASEFPEEEQLAQEQSDDLIDPTHFTATEPAQPVPASELPEGALGESESAATGATPLGDEPNPNLIAESDVAAAPVGEETPATVVMDAGADSTPERSRLDEALERSRTIPYEAPQPPLVSDHDTEETSVLDTAPETAQSETFAASSADEERRLAEERRRDDEAFEQAMIGTASTEGLIVTPQKRGNRTFALIMAVLTTVVFAALYAFAFAAARFLFTPGADILTDAWAFVGTAAFYVPVALFAIIMVIWSVISNRAGWWSYVLASLLLALVAFGGHYVGIAGQEIINGGAWSNQALLDAIRAPENLPGALIAFIAARESSNWIGGLIAARGRRLTRLNKRDADEYERRVAEERELSGISHRESVETS